MSNCSRAEYHIILYYNKKYLWASRADSAGRGVAQETA
jgi:hypothetical protein